MIRQTGLLLFVVIALLSGLGSRSQVVLASSPAHPVRSAAHTMLQIINTDRRSAGLSSLQFDPRTTAVALAHSKDMALHGYLSHTGLDGSTPFTRMGHAGISYQIAGENIGYDTGTSRNAMLRVIELAMLRSPEHRANLLRTSFSHVGIGVAASAGRIYVTEDFTG